MTDMTVQDIYDKYGIKPNDDVKEKEKTIGGSYSRYGSPVKEVYDFEEEMFEDTVPQDHKLKKKDLYRTDRLEIIRKHMIDKKGADYIDAADEKVVEDFVDNMRNFNTNVISTAAEARYISKSNDEAKNIASQAYDIYDSLGNVFVNDGVYGAVDGVKDYVFAIATDPTNYVGLLTGGLGKAAALGVTTGSKSAIRAAASAAARRALKDGANKKAIDDAASLASREMTKKLVGSNYTSASMKNVAEKAAEEARITLRSKIAKKAMREAKREKLKKVQRDAVLQTTVIDSLLAGVQDIAIQDIYLDVGSQEKFSQMQTGLALTLGGVGGGLHYAFGKFDGISGLAEAMDDAKAATRGEEFPLRKLKAAELKLKKETVRLGPDAKEVKQLQKEVNKLKTKAIGKPMLKKEAIDKAKDSISNTLKSWNEKVLAGDEELKGSKRIPESLLKQIMLGEDGKSGLAGIFKEEGIKFSRNTRVSDVMTNLLQYMPEEDLQNISKEFSKASGIKIGEITSLPVQIGDIIASDISGAGSTLAVMSQVRRIVDGGVVAGIEILAKNLKDKDVRDALDSEFGFVRGADKKSPKRLTYAQNIWKRLLVSSPATTAANVAGFAQFYGGQTVADLFSSGLLGVAGAAQYSLGNFNKSKDLFRQAKVYKDIQTQKMKNFVDPLTTYETYMSLMEQIKDSQGRKDIKGLLFETIGAGVERTGKRYNIDPNSPYVKNAELFADAAMTITGVRVQDTFTKSQMFITELDKYIRLKNKDMTLIDVLKSGDLSKIDDDVIGGAVDTTLRSVFSKDYTGDDQLLGGVAKAVENASNTPLLGTVIPFGRFMNNVVATAYQWSPLSLVGVAKNIVKGKRDIKNTEAFSRALVGTAALKMAIEFDEERQNKGLAANEVDIGGGTILDVRNVFPFSYFLVAGRAANLKIKTGKVPPEIQEELGNQLAIGQVARDVQFGNDLFNTLDFFLSEGDRGKDLDALYKSLGNIAAGTTRPLDAVNRAVGFLAGNDTAKDVRQTTGLGSFVQPATKYFDNIIEVMIGETEILTGENLRVATREGDIYDANPLARIFGVNVKKGKTATEKAYSLAQMQTWKADQRSKMPMYDRIFNKAVAPLLEPKMERLLRSKSFQEDTLNGKRRRVREVLKDARQFIRDAHQSDIDENFMDRLRYKATTKGSNQEVRDDAMRYMKDKGVDASLDEFNFRELMMYNSYIDHLEYIAKEGL